MKMRQLFDQKFPGFQRIAPEWIPDDIKHSITEQFPLSVSEETVEKKQLSAVSISRIRKFLESPLQSTAANILGLSEEEEDISEKIEEPLLLDRLSEWLVLRKIWDRGLNSADSEPDWTQLYDLQTQRMELEGELPIGVFGEAAQSKQLRILKRWQVQATSAIGVNWQILRKNLIQFNFGGVKEETVNDGMISSYQFVPRLHLQDDQDLPADVVDTNLLIHGKTEWWYTDESENWYCIYFCERQSKDKNWLRHFLDVLILRAADLIPDNANISGLCIAAEGNVVTRKIYLPSQEQAEKYLIDLTNEMNYENNAVLMPVESVLQLSKENLSGSDYNARFAEWMDSKLQSSRENLGISSEYGPVKYLKEVPYPDNPYLLMNSRFGLFFDTVQL